LILKAKTRLREACRVQYPLPAHMGSGDVDGRIGSDENEFRQNLSDWSLWLLGGEVNTFHKPIFQAVKAL
jgi:hypothetical protein